MRNEDSLQCIVQGIQMIFIGRNEVVAKVMFLQVSVCPQGGRVSASVHAGMPYPPPGPGRPPTGPGRPPEPGRPPGTRQTPPPDQADPPAGPGRPPRDQADTPPGKQTPAYGLRAAGTHPTGMHSCFSKLAQNKLRYM